jgi:hypothetical protein
MRAIKTLSIKTLAMMSAATIMALGPAHATKRRHVEGDVSAEQSNPAAFPFFNPFTSPFMAADGNASKPVYAGSAGGRPHAWCGWWARQQVGQDPGPEFNLVTSWRKWGSQTGPVPGAIAIWRGARHVGKVVSAESGEVCTTSGNSGGATGVGTRCEPLSHFEQFRI